MSWIRWAVADGSVTHAQNVLERPNLDDRVNFWLIQWARFCRIDDTDLGYPSTSSPFIGGGESQRADDWLDGETEKVWIKNCQAMNALIDDLPRIQELVIRKVYLGENLIFRERIFEPVRHNTAAYLDLINVILGQASQRLIPGMNDRDIL